MHQESAARQKAKTKKGKQWNPKKRVRVCETTVNHRLFFPSDVAQVNSSVMFAKATEEERGKKVIATKGLECSEWRT